MKCKTYKKTHKSKKALNGHIRNIKKRGGTASYKKTGKNYQLTYKFK